MIRVAFVVNGEPAGAMGHRARAFAERLRGRFDPHVLYRSRRKVASAASLLTKLSRLRPDVCYVLDMGASGVVATAGYKGLTGKPLIIDTGDAITDLARSMGRSTVGVALTRCLEETGLRAADRIVVRGSYHAEWLARRGIRADVIPDGVEPDVFAPQPTNGVRHQLGLPESVLAVGLVGASVWSERLQTCYGWDLVEALRLLRDRPIAGVLIGDGSGIAVLEKRCREYGITDRVRFVGRIPYAELPEYLAALDVCLSTQTNDLVGQVRTTGKLPLYLAAGRYVLASRVGEAARVLPEDMLVEYRGKVDPEYPVRLAERLDRLLEQPHLLARGLQNVAVARERFDYDVLAGRVAQVIEDVAQGRKRIGRVAGERLTTPSASTRQPRLAVLCDLAEEQWPSMDLAAEMLLRELHAEYADEVSAERVCPPFRHRFGRIPGLGTRRVAFNADRLLNRHWDYPRFLRQHARQFDFFHICDHSYAHIVHALPPGRVGVLCHDLDTFRCLIEPDRDRRPRWFREMARHVLRGLQKAAVVFYLTEPVREQIVRHGLLDPARLVKAPNGVADEFTPHGPATHPLPELCGRPHLLHVGSCIPRKRINVLLDVFAAVRRGRPELMLLQVGGEWTPQQQQQIHQLGIADVVKQVRGLDREQVAKCYRQATLVLLPSEAEGFGLPTVEALACGTRVVASDIPVFREVGGDAVMYCPVADISAWADAVGRHLDDHHAGPSRDVRLARAAQYTWAAHARAIMDGYHKFGLLAQREAVCASST